MADASTSPNAGLAAKVRELAARPCGVTVAQLVASGFSEAGSQMICCWLTREAEVVRVGAGQQPRRYFSSKDAADAWVLAHPAKVQKPRRASPLLAKSGLFDRLRALAARPEGCDADDLAREGFERKSAAVSMCKLVAREGLVRVMQMTGKPRVFADRDLAAAWREADANRGPALASTKQRPAWSREGLPDGVQIKRVHHRPARDGEAVITERTRHVVAPAVTHDPRYQVNPASRPYGAGFAAVGIGRDVETGRGWAA